MRDLTDRQRMVFDFIEDAILDTGIAPTIKEIREKCGYRNDTPVMKVLEALEKKRFIRRQPLIRRGIELGGRS